MKPRGPPRWMPPAFPWPGEGASEGGGKPVSQVHRTQGPQPVLVHRALSTPEWAPGSAPSLRLAPPALPCLLGPPHSPDLLKKDGPGTLLRPLSGFPASHHQVTDFIFLGSKITADGDCSHETEGCLFLERKATQT